MPPREKPNQRPTPDVLPDSLPDKDKPLEGDLRRRDTYDTGPDSLPRVGEDGNVSVNSLAPSDIDDHPTHDEPMDDLGPEDFEKLVDEAAAGQLERRIDDETIDPRADAVFAPGSSEPLDIADKPLSLERR